MGSLIQLNGKWRAQIRRKGHPPQCKTFTKKTLAEAWIRQVEADMDAGRVGIAQSELTVRNVIEAYRKMRDSGRPILDDTNEYYQLKTLDKYLGDKQVATMTPDDLLSFAAQRKEEDRCGPYTINMDISKLGTVLRYGGAYLRVAFPDIIGASRPLLTHMRLIGGGNKRTRRPTQDEFDRIVQYMSEKYGVVYSEAVLFAAASAMRRGEIVALRRSDIDYKKRTALVLRKHPRKGKALETVPLLSAAWDILMRQPEIEGDDRFFPIHESTLSKYFTWTCRELSIPDLHLHDMRHEGSSRLIESGLSIPEACLVTGHRKWDMLQRYTQLSPEGLVAKELKVTNQEKAA